MLNFFLREHLLDEDSLDRFGVHVMYPEDVIALM